MDKSRKPILINKNTVAFIQLFTKTDDLDDIIFGCWEDYDREQVNKDAAKEFISQLKGRWSVNFLKALAKECELAIKEFGLK
uniref:Uncharacterized protein n=1 Tax=viral metagenome TaxID=1070528 RepID=A0A6M3JIM0_9ZZZZ